MNQYCVYLLSKNDAVYSKKCLQTGTSNEKRKSKLMLGLLFLFFVICGYQILQ